MLGDHGAFQSTRRGMICTKPRWTLGHWIVLPTSVLVLVGSTPAAPRVPVSASRPGASFPESHRAFTTDASHDPPVAIEGPRILHFLASLSARQAATAPQRFYRQFAGIGPYLDSHFGVDAFIGPGSPPVVLFTGPGHQDLVTYSGGGIRIQSTVSAVGTRLAPEDPPPSLKLGRVRGTPVMAVVTGSLDNAVTLAIYRQGLWHRVWAHRLTYGEILNLRSIHIATVPSAVYRLVTRPHWGYVPMAQPSSTPMEKYPSLRTGANQVVVATVLVAAVQFKITVFPARASIQPVMVSSRRPGRRSRAN